ncbi:GspH/FimT family protein [Shewanella sp.]|nr:GspH/FimT family protein [Shewanella sp.]
MFSKVHGLTLIEFIVALTVGIILLTVALPSFSSMYAYIRTDMSIRKIHQSIQLARNHAIVHGTRVTLCPIKGTRCSTNWLNKISIFIDTGEPRVINSGDTVIQTLSPFYAQDLIHVNRAAISFQPDGLAAGSNGTVKYCAHNNLHAKAIVINRAGRSRVSTEAITCSDK